MALSPLKNTQYMSFAEPAAANLPPLKIFSFDNSGPNKENESPKFACIQSKPKNQAPKKKFGTDCKLSGIPNFTKS